MEDGLPVAPASKKEGATQSTCRSSSGSMSAKTAGVCVPLVFAEVDNSGLLSLRMRDWQKS